MSQKNSWEGARSQKPPNAKSQRISPIMGNKWQLPILMLLIIGFMGALTAIAPPSKEDTPYRDLIRIIGLVLSLLSFSLIFYIISRTPKKEGKGEEEKKRHISTGSGKQLITPREPAQRLLTKAKGKGKRQIASLEEGQIDLEDLTLATRFINYLTWGGSIKRWFPIIGILIIGADLVYNLLGYFDITEGIAAIQSFDSIILLLGGIFIVYNYIPEEYAKERDFFFLFMVFLSFILVYFLYFIVGPLSEDSTEPNAVIEIFLARPVAFLLNLFGIESSVAGQEIRYAMNDGSMQSVWIGHACSGIYSMSIFLSMFFSFIMVEYSRFTRLVAGLLGIGILLAYIANLLRMTIIVAVGSFYGPDALYWTHKEVGWMIFMGWVFLFWWGSFKVMDKAQTRESENVSKSD